MFNPEQKVLALNPRRGFFMADGIHLVNPEKPFVILPPHYEATAKVRTAIEAGVLKDVNDNVIGEGAEKAKQELKAAKENAKAAQKAQAEAAAKAQAEAQAAAAKAQEDAAKAAAEPAAEETTDAPKEEGKSKKK